MIIPCQKFFTEDEKCYLSDRPFPAKISVIKNNDIWIRDYGPFFLKKGNKTVIAETVFNAWGAKFPPFTYDNKIPEAIAQKTGYPLVTSVPYIFEGGAIEVNGDGLAITTLDCLTGKNRNAAKDVNKVVKALCKAFGLRDMLVLPHGLHGDHTDGHIDNVARFVAKDRIVMCEATDKRSPNNVILTEAKYLIETWLKSHYGKSAKVDTLPLPPQRKLDDGQILPASYMNFIYANGALIFPKYKSPNDAKAKAYFESVYPDRQAREFIRRGQRTHNKKNCDLKITVFLFKRVTSNFLLIILEHAARRSASSGHAHPSTESCRRAERTPPSFRHIRCGLRCRWLRSP